MPVRGTARILSCFPTTNRHKEMPPSGCAVKQVDAELATHQEYEFGLYRSARADFEKFEQAPGLSRKWRVRRLEGC